MQTETIVLPGIGTFELDFELEGGSPADGLFGTYIDILSVRLACDSHAHEMGETFVEIFGVHLQTFLRQKLRDKEKEL